jgi:large subunit ribosomal protein L15
MAKTTKSESPKRRATAKKTAARPAAKTKAASASKAAKPEKKKPAPQVERLVLPPGMGVHDLRPARGATHSKKRVGRGPGSGHGKTAGRGSKGQKSRSGYVHMRGFEGGQMPLHRRLPKRGFTNIFRTEYDIVPVGALEKFAAGEEVNPEKLAARGLVRKTALVKILGDGAVTRALTVVAHRFSASARAKIEKSGGRCQEIVTEKVAR